MRKRTIKIAGAGPSGLTAGINLALAGYPVDVFERRSDTGKRFHGDLQGLENWSDKEPVLDEFARMNINVNFDCDPFMQLTITNGEKTRVSHYDEPLCYLVKRGVVPGSLDKGLKQQALDAGVNIHFEQTIPLDEADIVATGPISKETFAVDKGIVFETDHEDLNVFLVNDAAAYKGYSYLLITKGYGCLCTVLFERFKELDACYETSKQIFSDMFNFQIENPTPVSGVGCFSTQNIYQKGKSLFTGEAAGLQDMLWGFGIRTAVQSGYLAAQAIIEDRDYAQLAHNTFNSKLKATMTSRFVWELIRFNNYNLVVDQQVSNISKNSYELATLYNFSPVLKVLYPFARARMRKRYPNLRI